MPACVLTRLQFPRLGWCRCTPLPPPREIMAKSLYGRSLNDTGSRIGQAPRPFAWLGITR